MNDVTQIIAGVIIGQIVMAVFTVVMIKVDLKWMKRQLVDHENRLRDVEQGKRRVSHVEDFEGLGV